MPFAVFRRHERKLLAIFAILAMVGFVLSDSLPALLRGSNETHRSDVVVATLYGKPVRLSDLQPIREERTLANAFMAQLMPRFFGFSRPDYFGETTTPALVDAYILQHEADKLGMPDDPELARNWLRGLTAGQMDRRLFDLLAAPYRHQNITGDQVLKALTSQVRVAYVQDLPGQPEVTPLDIYQAYRDRYERISADAVRIPVSDFLSQVPAPGEEELRAFYDRYKQELPDPAKPTPGFKVPRRIQVEYVFTDAEKLANEIRARLSEKEIAEYYASRKTEFALPPLLALPETLFEGDAKNERTPPPAQPADASPETVPDTSPRYQPLSEIHARIVDDLAHERAHDVISRKFEAVKEVMLEYSDAYAAVLDENKEAKGRGESGTKKLPPKVDLHAVAAKEGLVLESTPLIPEDEAAHLSRIGSSHAGTSRISEGRSFAEEMFRPDSPLFEPIELTNDQGIFFLAWKIADQAPRIPPLAEIRNEVVQAWKLRKAVPLAKQAAEAIAEQARKAGGKISAGMAANRAVFTTDPVSRLETQVLPMPGQFSPPRPRPSEISLIPNAGEALRDALFSLEPGQVAVALDEPQTAYYVLTLHQKFPVDYTSLYATNGPFRVLQIEVYEEARDRRRESWLADLRSAAGLPADWKPPEEAETPRSRRRA